MKYLEKLVFRGTLTTKDIETVRQIVSSSNYFSNDEIKIAVELVEERLKHGLKSGYYFLFAELKGKTVGYTCFGPIPATKYSQDLYWIAVDEKFRGKGIGKILINKTEKEISKLGGKRVYVETSGLEKYKPTRDFYLSCKYDVAAVLKEFYAPSDDKFIFLKVLT